MWILWRKASLARTAYNENEIIKRNSRKLYLNRKKDIHKNHKMRWTKTYITCEAYYYTTFPNSSHTHKANKGRKSCFHMLYRKNRAMRNSKFNAWFKNEILFYCVTTTKPSSVCYIYLMVCSLRGGLQVNKGEIFVIYLFVYVRARIVCCKEKKILLLEHIFNKHIWINEREPPPNTLFV